MSNLLDVALTAQLLHDAENRVLSDVDSLANWLAGECDHVKGCDSERITRYPHLQAQRMAEADVCQLLQLVMTSEDAHDIKQARDTLRAKYLLTCGDYLQQTIDGMVA